MIADMKSNKKSYHIVTELILGGRKLNISFLFISQYRFLKLNDYMQLIILS